MGFTMGLTKATAKVPIERGFTMVREGFHNGALQSPCKAPIEGGLQSPCKAPIERGFAMI